VNTRGREDAERLTADVIELARHYGRYSYRKGAALLRQAIRSECARQVIRRDSFVRPGTDARLRLGRSAGIV
jgi:hypothetical protein